MHRGQTLVELLIVMAVLAIALPGLLTGMVASREGKPQQERRLKALNLLQETQEALRNIREEDWDNVSVNGLFHPSISGSTWQLVTGTTTVDGMTLGVTLASVRRNSSGAIVSSGGTIDPSTKQATITVSWTTPRSSSVTSTIYLTRYLDNLSYAETTAADFNAGTQTNVTVTNTSGGEVVLGAGGTGNWCAPDLELTHVDLPKNGVANAIAAIEGKVFAGTGENASGISYATVNISNTSPPTGTIAATFDGYKTNGIVGETNYAYLATDNHGKEVVIVNLTQIVSGKYQEAGYFDAPGSTNGQSVFVAGNVGYTTTANNKLYSFDLSSKSGSRPLLDPDGVSLAGLGTRVFVVGNYAYISISGNSSVEMQIVDVSNTSNLQVVGQFNLNSQGAQDIYVNTTGTRAYIATANSLTQNELFALDVTQKTSPRLMGSYDTVLMSPKAVVLVPGNRALIGGAGGQAYQVVNISESGNPATTIFTPCAGLVLTFDVRGIASVTETDGDAYAYVLTNDSTAELRIVKGGPGGQYVGSGTFESRTFDTTSVSLDSTAFNRFTTTYAEPPGTDIKFQVAVADPVSNSCTGVTYTFVGPDGTNSTYFEDSSPIPFDDNGTGFENPGRCFRYRAYYTTSDPNASAVLYDFTANMSP